MGGVVPAGRQRVRIAVEDDAAADEHEPVDDCSTAPNSCEEEDRHAEFPVELLEKPASASWDSTSTPAVGSSRTSRSGS